jgi:predicted metal-dependent hydrolase
MSDVPDSPTPSSAAPASYDHRYLAGIVCFNRGDYFDAHEVWEALWMNCSSADRRFVQSLIQAAVSLYHWGNGNRAGADRLFHSGRRYMEPYRPHYHGLDVGRFWSGMEEAFSVPGFHPTIVLDPPPDRWPDPSEVHHE